MNKAVKLFIETIFALVMMLMVCAAAGLFSINGKVIIKGDMPKNQRIQLFYLQDWQTQFDEINSKSENIKFNFINFNIPSETVFNQLRVDLGDSKDLDFKLNKVLVKRGNKSITLDCTSIRNFEDNGFIEYHDVLVDEKDGSICLTTTSDDGYFILKSEETSIWKFDSRRVLNIIIISFIITCLLEVYIKKNHIFAEIKVFFVDVIRNKKILLSMAKTDFISHYAGSYFGIIWAIIQPVFTILIYSLVFQIGFRSGSSGDIPFALWLTTGLVPWFYFSEAWNSSTNVFLEYSYLVKKVVFSLDILPLVKIISSLFTHIAFNVIVIIAYTCYGIFPGLSILQVMYYLIAMICLTMGLALLTAPVVVFFRDLTQVIGIVLQFGVWLTPIMWNLEIFPETWREWFKINPMFYIVQGYRDCFSGNSASILYDMQWTMYFWVVVIVIFAVGFSTYSKLKEHMADVL